MERASHSAVWAGPISMRRLARLVAACAIGLTALGCASFAPAPSARSTGAPTVIAAQTSARPSPSQETLASGAPRTVAFVTVLSPVTRGSSGEVTVRTMPGASCSITVTYASGPSSAQGLTTKTASENGIVSWSWTVGTQTAPGAWPIDVRCGDASAQAMFRVQ